MSSYNAIDIDEESVAFTGASKRCLINHTSFHGQMSPLLVSNKKFVRAELDKKEDALPKEGYDNRKHHQNRQCTAESGMKKSSESSSLFLYAFIYGVVNSIMGIPSMYGYASIIFNNSAYDSFVNELSKLVLWSSVVHQVSFVAFSSLPFSIGQVQDAGLIFLSHMANKIANEIVSDGGSSEEIISTSLVILSMATFSTGIVLIVLGKFRLADLVSYLPLPVIGGYLACKSYSCRVKPLFSKNKSNSFILGYLIVIGYFCGQAGVALSISKPMIGLKSWVLLSHPNNAMLALPGILAGLAMAFVSRNVRNDAALPILMVTIPMLFYIILIVLGMSLEDAREYGWIGKISPPVPAKDLLSLIDFGKVRWNLAFDCVSTWIGMVFVVSFSSCLDVAAIAMDMGTNLDINDELMTVGLSNTLSGLSVGFTGSYIFSQTIFTCRTGTHSRLIGMFVASAELAVVFASINILEIIPLFFLGSTLTFIALDLLYEWLIEIRHKVLLSEYCVLLATFISMHAFGINFGIFFGFVISVGDYVFKSAKVSSVTKVSRRSRAVWRPEQWKLLQAHGYHIQNPKIMTFEIKGTIFFGSSMQLLSQLSDELCLPTSPEDMKEITMASPGPHRGSSTQWKRSKSQQNFRHLGDQALNRIFRPRFVVLDLSQVANTDSTAARGCFFHLAKACSNQNIILCGCGANSRVDWVLRAHDAAYPINLEDDAKRKASNRTDKIDKIILFSTVSEALEFCEANLILEFDHAPSHVVFSKKQKNTNSDKEITVRDAFLNILGPKDDVEAKLEVFEMRVSPFHTECEYMAGEAIFQETENSDCFFVVLSGVVALFQSGRIPSNVDVLSGAGAVESSRNYELGDVQAYVPVGGIFGYVDFILEQSRLFSAVSARDKTVVARLHRNGLSRMKKESSELSHILDRVLLQVSIHELMNSQEL
jgi:MFS superfamily sulfate permease-like transporter